jgi:hypothetical protein
MKTKYKLGKLPARKDTRTIKMSAILKTLPPIPDEHDVDAALTGIADDHMFANNKYGDCVMAARAHMTLRFEKFEQNQLISITDKNVTDEYFKETGGPDTGLNMLDSLNYWRQTGWTLADGHNYKIHAFASVEQTDTDQTKAAIYLFRGVYFGIWVAQYYYDQFKAGNYFWDVVANDGGNIGGHALYGMKYLKIKATGYNDIGPIFITWGKYVQVTWAWWKKYVEEAYIVIDERDSWIPQENDPLEIDKMEQLLSEVTNAPSQKISIMTLSLPNGIVNQPYSFGLYAQGGSPPYTWGIQSGTLPTGITFSSDGVLSGTPTVEGNYQNILFMVKDSTGNAIGSYLSILIKKNEPPVTGCCKTGKSVLRVILRSRLVTFKHKI